MTGPSANPIRVMIIDDSVVVRRLVSTTLDADPEIKVVATASNGRQGLQRIVQAEPDLVILDVEMPELGGLETLVEIRREYPRLPVIMFSSLTRRGAAATLDAPLPRGERLCDQALGEPGPRRTERGGLGEPGGQDQAVLPPAEPAGTGNAPDPTRAADPGSPPGGSRPGARRGVPS